MKGKVHWSRKQFGLATLCQYMCQVKLTPNIASTLILAKLLNFQGYAWHKVYSAVICRFINYERDSNETTTFLIRFTTAQSHERHMPQTLSETQLSNMIYQSQRNLIFHFLLFENRKLYPWRSNVCHVQYCSRTAKLSSDWLNCKFLLAICLQNWKNRLWICLGKIHLLYLEFVPSLILFHFESERRWTLSSFLCCLSVCCYGSCKLKEILILYPVTQVNCYPTQNKFFRGFKPNLFM